MTEQELRQALEEKGYHYEEANELQYGYLCVYACKGEEKKCLGTKKMLLMGKLEGFKQNEAYTKL